MKIRIRRFVLFLLPAPFIYLSLVYNDYFYLIPAVITLFFALIFSQKKILAKKELSLPDLRPPKIKRFGIKLPTRGELSKLQEKGLYKRLGRHAFSGLTILFFLFVLLFVFITVYRLPEVSESKSLLRDYFQAHFTFAKENALLSTIFLFGSTLLVAAQLKKKIAKRLDSLILISIPTSLALVFTSLSLAFLGTFLYGIAEVNVLSFRIRANPSGSGLVWGKEEILEEIKNKGEAPKLVGVDSSVDELVLELNLDEDKAKSHFYKTRVVENIPDAFLPTLGIPKESLVLYKDYLLITELVKEDIEAVSPLIGKLYLKRQLAPRYIKDEPQVQVMGRQEYLKYREDMINEQIDTIDSLITEAQSSINTLNSAISQARQKIAENERGLNDSTAAQQDDYNYCKTAGYNSYYFGFIRYYSDETCQRWWAEWDATIAVFKENINVLNNALSQAQQSLVEWREWKETLEYTREFVAAQKDITPQELGIFEPEKTVKVVLDYVGSKSVADFYVTLVHEYLHYTSYVSEERYLPPFFEEGLTEYFARKIIKEELETSTNLGYPLIVKIIAEMSKKIPEDALLNVYFNKDEKLLISTLNDIYGDNFYEESERYFTLMPYVSSKEALKTANNIMFRVGGSKLTEKDLESTYPGLK